MNTLAQIKLENAQTKLLLAIASGNESRILELRMAIRALKEQVEREGGCGA